MVFQKPNQMCIRDRLYQYAQRGGADMKYAFSTALVLLVTVLIINICAKLVAYRIRKKRSV